VEGITTQALRGGIGHDPASGLPGTASDVVLVGRRVTHGAPFLRLDALTPGCLVVLRTSNGHTFLYRVHRTDVVDAYDVRGITAHLTHSLILVTNTPKYTALRRLLVIASPAHA
jgi:sortase A